MFSKHHPKSSIVSNSVVSLCLPGLVSMNVFLWGAHAFAAKPGTLHETPADPVVATSEQHTPSSQELVIPFESYKLKNGMTVILHEDHRNPFVAVSVWYHVGAYHEVPGKTGFAHLFEHLMFQGTPNVGDDNHIAYLEQAGASIRDGMVNGTTNQDRTNYFEVVPQHELELALWLESDRMGFLMDGMTQEKLDEQRAVVQNERYQGVENAPYGLAEERLWKSIFPSTHPYYGMVIGSIDDLNAARLADVGEFFTRYYAPSNATLTIAGDFSSSQAKDWVNRYFGSLPSTEKPARKKVEPPSLEDEVRIEVQESLGKLPYVQLKYFTPPLFTQEDAAFDILSSVLAGGKSARLTKQLVEEKQIAQSVQVYQQSMANVSVFSIDVMLRENEDPAAAIALIDETIAHLAEHPPKEEEVERARNVLETQRLYGLQKIGGFSGKAEQLQTYNHYVGDPNYLAKDFARYTNVSTASISDAVRDYLVPKRRGVLIALPVVDAPPPTAQEVSP